MARQYWQLIHQLRLHMSIKKGIFLIGAALLATTGTQAASSPWEKYKTPVTSAPEAIGKYANGCLVGGVPVPTEGPGYQVVRLARTRNYAHPEMRDFLMDLGQKVERNNLGLMLVADVAMPRGGRFTKGHRSHQTGLDADIWLRLNAPQLPVSKRQKMYDVKAVLMVDRDKFKVNREWGNKQGQMIKLAAKDKRVARIFVHPAIKQELCETAGDTDRDWLRTVRPWYGHDSHFHVRMHCQGNDCVAQNPPPAGDGCGKELKSWFPKPKPKTKPKPAVKKPKPKPVKKKPYVPPPPPPRCQMVLKDKFKLQPAAYAAAAKKVKPQVSAKAQVSAKPKARIYARGDVAAKSTAKPAVSTLSTSLTASGSSRSGSVLPSQVNRSQPKIDEKTKQQVIAANKLQIELAQQRRAKAIAEQERQRLARERLAAKAGNDDTADSADSTRRQSLRLLPPR